MARRRKKANGDAVTVCREMSRLDPHYDKHVGPVNPFESMLRYEESVLQAFASKVSLDSPPLNVLFSIKIQLLLDK